MSEINPKVEAALKRAAERRLWGTIQITFKAGKPVLITSTQTEPIDHHEGESNGNRDDKR